MDLQQLLDDLEASTSIAKKATLHADQLLDIIYMAATIMNKIAMNKGEICPEMVAQDAVLKINALMATNNQRNKISNDS